jgi:S1-C subfamily serine protease
LYATEIEDKVVVVGLAKDGPAQRADLRTGDVVLTAGGAEVSDLAGLYRRVWGLGPAGVEVPLSIYRDGKTFEAKIKSSDRNRHLKAPRMH